MKRKAALFTAVIMATMLLGTNPVLAAEISNDTVTSTESTETSVPEITIPESAESTETECTETVESTEPEGTAEAMESTETLREETTEEDTEETEIEESEKALSGNAGIYVASIDQYGFYAGMNVENMDLNSTEFRWLYYDGSNWNVAQDWMGGMNWVRWTPPKFGDYVVQAEARTRGTEDVVTAAAGFTFHPQIKAKCQMPYSGDGGGYLIGVESFENNNYSYELLVLDCNLLQQGKDAWIYTTGKCGTTGNAFWTVWQPEVGYYWTLFRVYDQNGTMIDQDCYGFVNNQVYPTIKSVDCKSAIEADVTLTGSGSGCHAKLVACTATSAISFGLQYDAYASAPYTGKNMIMMENVYSNDAGGQQYSRPGGIEVPLGQKVHLMLTVNEDGSGSVYVNHQLVGNYYNPGLASKYLYLRVEGAARVNGDTVNAEFNNIKLKNALQGQPYDPDKTWATNNVGKCPTIQPSCSDWKNITIGGMLTGLGAGQDWDSAYEQVSGIVQLNW